jgi:hypothetical protein
MDVGHLELEVWLILVFYDDIGGDFADDFLETCRVIVDGDEMIS